MGDFHTVDRAFKELVTSWQMRVIDGEEVVNDHTDEAYDNAGWCGSVTTSIRVS